MLLLRRILLYPFAVLYQLITGTRNLLYDLKIIKSKSFSIPVISIGNLSAGGTGKTPHAEYVINLLNNRYKTAYLSRGYKRKTKGFILVNDSHSITDVGDEAIQVFRKFKSIPVAVDEKRVHGIETLLNCFPDIQVIVLDDAFQHRAVKPSFSILLTEFNRPYFKDFILPAGYLRESHSNASRADMIIVTKGPEKINREQRDLFLSYIKPSSKQTVLFSFFKYGSLQSFTGGSSLQWQDLKKTNVILFAGIGNPEPLVEFLRKNSESVTSLIYADHHFFSDGEITKILEKFDTFAGRNKIILTTEKDFMRLSTDTIRKYFSNRGAFYITVKVNFNKEEEIIFNKTILDHVAKN